MPSHRPQRRKFFRIHYTARNCPFFRFQAMNFEVVDLSEEGFKFELNARMELKSELEVSGVLNFRDGESFLVHGSINRISKNTVVVKLKGTLPLRKIMSEQRSLIRGHKEAS